ncbi:hypothetical protein BKA58DRAFT_11641 [Alternaria rosae]|uniref:uncharacterized protein n=1 Tax=Alternaria rosae TaxID=1187941 RepID=UPI001E8CD8B1|nr:uncharacterized protein BKA58DRAFT_11641 [Alternaria rosae]KAH6881998.1 hypothetical protein BKA58DRAFT_11641 [Alternaria rosae]
MTQNAPSFPTFPSHQQIALALAIVRSKPAGIQIRDYILQLRAQIRPGPDPRERDNAKCHIDQVAYWKERCQQAEDECGRLRGVNIKLERSNHLLSNISVPFPDIYPSMLKAPTVSPKRSKPSRQAQRQCLQPAAAAQETIQNDMDFLNVLGKDGSNLTEALYTTHSLCRSDQPDTDTLCHNLVKVSSGIGKIICVVAQNYDQLSRQGQRTLEAMSLDQDKSDFAIALSVCARAFMSLLVGTNKLMEANADTRLTSLIVCEVADMFKAALQSIELSARKTAQNFLSQPPSPKKTKTKTPPSIIKESPPARAVAHLLISFLGFLEKTDPVHQKIFDGFIFVLFERVGKRLYYFTFGQHRSTSIDGNIFPPLEPRDETEETKQDADALGTRLEVKALVLILERAMGLAPNHMNPQNARPGQTSNRPVRTLSIKTPATSTRARLSSLAKDRLQRTLVACMYGNNTNDEFLDVLTKPLPAMRLSALQNVAKIDDKDVGTWYKEEIWRLVGWDVLARESAW